jgi:hypothetical protein
MRFAKNLANFCVWEKERRWPFQQLTAQCQPNHTSWCGVVRTPFLLQTLEPQHKQPQLDDQLQQLPDFVQNSIFWKSESMNGYFPKPKTQLSYFLLTPTNVNRGLTSFLWNFPLCFIVLNCFFFLTCILNSKRVNYFIMAFSRMQKSSEDGNKKLSLSEHLNFWPDI